MDKTKTCGTCVFCTSPNDEWAKLCRWNTYPAVFDGYFCNLHTTEEDYIGTPLYYADRGEEKC